MKRYAYVTTQTCTRRDAVLPGTWVGNHPVSRHGDYQPWTRGKRETISIAQGHGNFGSHFNSDVGYRSYMCNTAREVCRLMWWQWSEAADWWLK
jgi:hypothetical protein